MADCPHPSGSQRPYDTRPPGTPLGERVSGVLCLRCRLFRSGGKAARRG